MISSGARIAAERSLGWNRQLRITPLSTRAYFRAKVLTGYAMAAISLLALDLAGTTLGVTLPAGEWVRMTALILVGLVPFAALGILLGHLLTADSIGPAIGGSTALLSILGGTWFPDPERWLPARRRADPPLLLARAGEPSRARWSWLGRPRLGGHDRVDDRALSACRRRLSARYAPRLTAEEELGSWRSRTVVPPASVWIVASDTRERIRLRPRPRSSGGGSSGILHAPSSETSIVRPAGSASARTRIRSAVPECWIALATASWVARITASREGSLISLRSSQAARAWRSGARAATVGSTLCSKRPVASTALSSLMPNLLVCVFSNCVANPLWRA